MQGKDLKMQCKWPQKLSQMFRNQNLLSFDGHCLIDDKSKLREVPMKEERKI